MVTLDDVLDGLETELEASGCPVATAPRVADHVDQSRRKTLDDLRLLERNGDIKSYQFGKRMVVWWPADNGVDAGAVDSSDTMSETSSVAPVQTRDESPEMGAETDTAELPERGELADEVFDHLEETNSPPKTSHGRLAIVDIFAALREHGTLSTGDLKGMVYPNYTDHWSSAKIMWESLSRHFGNVPGIEKGGYGEWEYTGDEPVREALEAARKPGIYDPTTEY